MVDSNRLDLCFFKYKEDYNAKIQQVLNSGRYILGEEVRMFEKEFANYIGVKYCIGVGCGYDSLYIAMKLLGLKKGDEVIVQANAYIADIMAITNNGLTPIFVDIDMNFCIDINKIKDKITNRTKALLLVYLYGNMPNMDSVNEICNEYGLFLIEDCAQAHGATFKGKKAGAFGRVACFSFYPTKNLGAFGDAGAILTDDENINKKARMFRNYGSDKKYINEMVGVNSRMDEIQAGLLRVKLAHLDELNLERSIIAQRYYSGIKNESLLLPFISSDVSCVWHQFVIRCEKRIDLMRYLDKHKIGYDIHYPVPVYLSKAYSYLDVKEGVFPINDNISNEILSLPLYIGMNTDVQNEVIDILNAYNGEI